MLDVSVSGRASAYILVSGSLPNLGSLKPSVVVQTDTRVSDHKLLSLTIAFLITVICITNTASARNVINISSGAKPITVTCGAILKGSGLKVAGYRVVHNNHNDVVWLKNMIPANSLK